MRKIQINLKNKKAQVWIETVIYTLIGLAVIGTLLAFAKPKIDSMKDRATIEQTIASFNSLNQIIYDLQSKGPENSRQLDLKITKGRLVFDPLLNRISWTISPSLYKYSEPGIAVSLGDLKIKTDEIGSSSYSVQLFKDYNVNITINDAQDKKELGQSSTLYSLIISNRGISAGRVLINVAV